MFFEKLLISDFMCKNSLNSKKDLIFKNNNFKINLLDDAIIINFFSPRNAITTSWLNGGYKEGILTVFNNKISSEDMINLNNNNFKDYLIVKSKDLDLDYNKSTGLITTALMSSYGLATFKFKKLEVIALVTAGVRYNASSAGDPSSYYEEDGNYYLFSNKFAGKEKFYDESHHLKFGTINIFVIINANLNENSLLSAMMTTIEAKTVALRNLLIPSQYSGELATGTGTDGISIISDLNNDNYLDNAGKHSKLGELIANAVISAINQSLMKGMYICPKSQANVLVRLDRLKFNINDFYDNLSLNGHDKREFIIKLKNVMCDYKNVAISSLIVELITQVRHGLMTKKVAFNLASNIVADYLLEDKDNPVKEILSFCINCYLV